jgi:hypothetical protein
MAGDGIRDLDDLLCDIAGFVATEPLGDRGNEVGEAEGDGQRVHLCSFGLAKKPPSGRLPGELYLEWSRRTKTSTTTTKRKAAKPPWDKKA